jgi:hypothetical protein
MQVHGVKSGIVSASNGGCDAFDINRSLAEGIINLKDEFLDSSPASLALGIIALQKNSLKHKNDFGDYAGIFSNLEI